MVCFPVCSMTSARNRRTTRTLSVSPSLLTCHSLVRFEPFRLVFDVNLQNTVSVCSCVKNCMEERGEQKVKCWNPSTPRGERKCVCCVFSETGKQVKSLHFSGGRGFTNPHPVMGSKSQKTWDAPFCPPCLVNLFFVLSWQHIFCIQHLLRPTLIKKCYFSDYGGHI